MINLTASALVPRIRNFLSRLVGPASLTNRRDVIDVDVEALMRHVIGCPARRGRVTFARLSQETTK